MSKLQYRRIMQEVSLEIKEFLNIINEIALENVAS